MRKLHQLTGIVPLGAFLLEHFYTNSKALTRPEDFNNAVREDCWEGFCLDGN